jgi:isochorismate hydrolase
MRHPRLLSKENTLLLITDVQEKFREHINGFNGLLKAICTLIEASKILAIPVVVTEQYPEGLGSTVAEITACLGAHQRFTKLAFSCCQQASLVTYLNSLGRKQVLMTGIECHVCVSQSVHDLLAIDYAPHLIVEAIGSRSLANKQIGLEKMVAAGAVISSVETALFELLVESGSATFKAVQKLVK